MLHNIMHKIFLNTKLVERNRNAMQARTYYLNRKVQATMEVGHSVTYFIPSMQALITSLFNILVKNFLSSAYVYA